MPIRMTGLVSNLDTESIIKELMAAQSQKKVKIENKITKNEWTTDIWKDLNSKLLAFYKGPLNAIKTQGKFQTKAAVSSDESKVKVTAGNEAVEGSHSVTVNTLASSQKVTSVALKANDSATNTPASKVTSSTKLADLYDGSGNPSIPQGTIINIDTETTNVTLDVDEFTTVGDFVNACKSAGLTANFDSAQQRLFISSSKSGIDGAFSINTSTSTATDEKNAVKDKLGYPKASSEDRTKIDSALNAYAKAEPGSDAETKAYKTLESLMNKSTTAVFVDKLKTDYAGGDSTAGDGRLAAAAAAAEQKYTSSLKPGASPDAVKLQKQIDDAVAKAASSYAAELKGNYTDGTASTGNPYYDGVENLKQSLNDYKTVYPDSEERHSAEKSSEILGNLGLSSVNYTKQPDGTLTYDPVSPAGMSLVEASDSEIEYNGATIKSSTNSVNINNLTLDLRSATNGQPITISVSKDTSAIYDLVKNFVKGYNDILGAMNNAYNAKPARGYEPLTDEQKDAMSEEEVKKWEKKIQDSLLRRDDSLSGIISTMRSSLQGGIQYNGKPYSLGSFGIGSALYTEKGLLHINGDPDDSLTSGESDKLKKAIRDEPNAVMSVLTKLTGSLYDNMTQKMKTSTMSSTLTFYKDKVMDKELEQYKKDLKKMEEKLAEMEDRYYKQFSAMEAAMSKMNSQSNSLASMLGTK